MIGGLSMFTFYFTFYFSNKPLGASTAYARVAGLVGYLFARRHTDSLHHYAQKKMPKIDWEVMLVGGIVLGAFLAAWTGGEVMARWLPPRWVARFGESVWLRLGLAFLGGGLMAFGARIAGGCASGHGIGGALGLSVGSWICLPCGSSPRRSRFPTAFTRNCASVPMTDERRDLDEELSSDGDIVTGVRNALRPRCRGADRHRRSRDFQRG
ncbi:MAG: YeeE/YedE thiosulfate transporter family protein [Planctomycetota bacterium]